jgi:hypothetical protein
MAVMSRPVEFEVGDRLVDLPSGDWATLERRTEYDGRPAWDIRWDSGTVGLFPDDDLRDGTWALRLYSRSPKQEQGEG